MDGILGFGLFIYTQFTHKFRLASVDNKFLPKGNYTKVLLKPNIKAIQLSLGICGDRVCLFWMFTSDLDKLFCFPKYKNHVKVYALGLCWNM